EISEVNNVGRKMKEIANRRYTWEVISDKYKALVSEVLVSKTKPAIVPSVTLLPTETLLKHHINHLHFQKLFFEK
ncbi:MAG TPA: hypothetical protein PLC27_13160, partial [Saprospiraceae bacterium]|nr:hypothetical protein [Saprospiraceae bacterium]